MYRPADAMVVIQKRTGDYTKTTTNCKEPSRALKFQIYGAEIWNWARNEKWYINDIKSRKGLNFDIISQLYHPLKNDLKNINILEKVI
jgi:hypothetical protein